MDTFGHVDDSLNHFTDSLDNACEIATEHRIEAMDILGHDLSRFVDHAISGITYGGDGAPWGHMIGETINHGLNAYDSIDTQHTACGDLGE